MKDVSVFETGTEVLKTTRKIKTMQEKDKGENWALLMKANSTLEAQCTHTKENSSTNKES